MTIEGTSAPLVVFDLDGTLTWRDTLVPFLARYVAARPARLLRLRRLPAVLLRYLLSGIDRGVLKARLVQMALSGDRRADIEAWAAQFVAAMRARGLFRADALAALELHRRAGHRLVLMSASPDLYVPLIGRLLGFERSVCTQLGWQGGQADGTLQSPNCLGQEKLRQLALLRSEYPGAHVVAYGNSSDDLAHLCGADSATLVNAGPCARRRAVRSGIAVAQWR